MILAFLSLASLGALCLMLAFLLGIIVTNTRWQRRMARQAQRDLHYRQQMLVNNPASLHRAN